MKEQAQTPDTFTLLVTARSELNQMEKLIAKQRETVRGLVARLGREMGAPEGGPVQQPRTRSRSAKRGQPGVNISEAVRAYVTRVTGVTVPEIMKALGLEDHEAAVRAALKKAKDKSLVNVNAKWYPIVREPAPEPQTQKDPAGAHPNGVWSAQSAEDVAAGYRNQ